MIHETAFVHERAHLDATVRLGARTKVWQFASLTRGTTFGADCTVSPGAVLDGLIAGDSCIVCAGVNIGRGFLVGSHVFLGPNVVFCNDAWPRTHKDGWSLDAFDGSRFAVIVGDGASIGANATILPGVSIGAGAMIAAGATVSRDVPAASLYRASGDVRPIEGAPRRLRFASDPAARIAAE